MTTKAKAENPNLASGDTSNRDIDDKIYDIMSTKDFGGVSDGVTHDTAAINTGIVKIAAKFASGILIIPPDTIYDEASLVMDANVTLLDWSVPGCFKVLTKDPGSALPVTDGGLQLKTQGIDGILFNAHNAGVAGNPFIRLLNANTGQLAGMLALFATITGYIDITESTAPSAPSAHNARLYTQTSGSGKTQLMVRFNTGAPIQLSIEP